MPIHDWTRVDAGLFHHFHQDWTIELCRALNAGRLPPGFTALTDQQTGGPIPDVLTLHRGPKNPRETEPGGGLAVAAAPPKARFVDADRGRHLRPARQPHPNPAPARADRRRHRDRVARATRTAAMP